MQRKISKIEEKLYEANREGKWESCEKKSYEQLMHKASLNLRERNKVEPYLGNYSKSKQLMTRIKEKPKNMKGTPPPTQPPSSPPTSRASTTRGPASAATATCRPARSRRSVRSSPSRVVLPLRRVGIFHPDERAREAQEEALLQVPDRGCGEEGNQQLSLSLISPITLPIDLPLPPLPSLPLWTG